MLIKKVKERKKEGWLPVIMGDFNSDIKKKVEVKVKEIIRELEVVLINSNQITHKKREEDEGSIIDLALVDESLKRRILMSVRVVQNVGHRMLVMEIMPNKRKEEEKKEGKIEWKKIIMNEGKREKVIKKIEEKWKERKEEEREFENKDWVIGLCIEAGKEVKKEDKGRKRKEERGKVKVGIERDCRVMLKKIERLEKKRKWYGNCYAYRDIIKRWKEEMKILMKIREEKRMNEKIEGKWKLISSKNNDRSELWKLVKKERGRGGGRLKVEEMNEEEKEEVLKFWQKIWKKKEIEGREEIQIQIEEEIEKEDKWSWIEDKLEQEEILNALNEVKFKKAPGVSDIGEIIKYIPEVISQLIKEVFNNLIHKNEYPKEWEKSLLILLHKKGNREEMGNYRPISLTEFGWRIMEKIVMNRIGKKIDEKLNDSQYGFREGRRTIDVLFIIRSMSEMACKKGVPLYVAMLDAKKAFDSADHQYIIKGYADLGMDKKSLRVIEVLLKNHVAVLTKEERSKGIELEGGVLQGGVKSPLDYAIFIEPLGVKDSKDYGVDMEDGEEKIGVLKYADDTTFISNDVQDMRKLLQGAEKFQEERGGEYVAKKCQMLMLGRISNSKRPDFYIKDNAIPYVSTGKLLGLNLSRGARKGEVIVRDVEESLQKVVNLIKALQFSEKIILPVEKVKMLVDSLFLSSALYGCEIVGITNQVTRKYMVIIRELTGMSIGYKSQEILESLGWMDINHIQMKRKLNYANRIRNWRKGGGVERSYRKQREEELPYWMDIKRIINELKLNEVWEEVKEREEDNEVEKKNKRIKWEKKVKEEIRFHQRLEWSIKLKIRMENISNIPHGLQIYKFDMGEGRAVAFFRHGRGENTCRGCEEEELDSPNHLIMKCDWKNIEEKGEREEIKKEVRWIRKKIMQLGEGEKENFIRLTSVEYEREEGRKMLRIMDKVWRERRRMIAQRMEEEKERKKERRNEEEIKKKRIIRKPEERMEYVKGYVMQRSKEEREVFLKKNKIKQGTMNQWKGEARKKGVINERFQECTKKGKGEVYNDDIRIKLVKKVKESKEPERKRRMKAIREIKEEYGIEVPYCTARDWITLMDC